MRHLFRKKHLLLFDIHPKRLYSSPVSVLKSQNQIPAITEGFEPQSWGSMKGLIRCSANYEPLSPMGFLERTGKVYSDKISIVYGSVNYTWSDTYRRCVKLASALVDQMRISRGDVIAILAPNIPAMYELHFAVPMAGGVLCPLNTRLDPVMLSVFLRHSEAKVVFVDHPLLELAQRALNLLTKSEKQRKPPIIILISQPDDDIDGSLSSLRLMSNSFDCEYESLLESGSVEFIARKPRSEWDPISINYTSGTTLRPKGVVCSHRGAYVNALTTGFLPKMGASSSPIYLWTIPMFHGNGWSLTWGMAAQGGTNVCLRKVSAKGIFKNIKMQNVTHMGGAPTVLNMILNSPMKQKSKLSRKVQVFMGGAPPPLQILTKMEELGFNVTNVYGMTELTGPGTYCESKPEWVSLPVQERSKLKARQGLKHLAVDEVDVKDPVTMESVPEDGCTTGEVMFRGNNVMMGYLKDLEATEEAFKGGWFHSGDIAVKHSDGCIEIRDRLKDLIISGGENINPIEVERVLCSHKDVVEVAVVARPDDHWGETPCAFVKLKDGFDLKSEEMIEFCRHHLPHFMAPKTVVFGDLPKTSSGKICKFILRQRAQELGSLS